MLQAQSSYHQHALRIIDNIGSKMNTSLPAVRKFKNKNGAVEYHIEVDSEWEGFDSFVQYVERHWQAEVVECSDIVYSRRWVLRSYNVPISVYHDSQIGNYFLREDEVADQYLLEKIEADLNQRLG